MQFQISEIYFQISEIELRICTYPQFQFQISEIRDLIVKRRPIWPAAGAVLTDNSLARVLGPCTDSRLLVVDREG
jgi:hypothetical protein